MPAFAFHAKRYAVPVTGGRLPLPPNPLLVHNTPEDIEYMKESIDSLLPVVLRKHFIKDRSHEGHKIYIAPELFNIPVAVGDRATTVQDTSSAVQGERFRVEGRDVRIFLNWGEGLPAQYLDLDLSAVILYKNGAVRNCDYTNLLQAGAVHSGDIRSIPAEVGTAEYVELDLRELRRTDAQYVLFMCNAYSMGGAATVILIVGAGADGCNGLKPAAERPTLIGCAGCGATDTFGLTPGAMRITGFCGATAMEIFGAAGATVGLLGLIEIGPNLTGAAGAGAGLGSSTFLTVAGTAAGFTASGFTGLPS